MVSNRNKINRFCKDNNIKLLSCVVSRFSTVVPECKISVTEYNIVVDIDGKKINYDSGDYGSDTTSEDVDIMLGCIKEDIFDLKGEEK